MLWSRHPLSFRLVDDEDLTMNDDLEKKLREARFFVEKMREQEARAFRARPCFASSRSPTAALQPCERGVILAAISSQPAREFGLRPRGRPTRRAIRRPAWNSAARPPGRVGT